MEFVRVSFEQALEVKQVEVACCYLTSQVRSTSLDITTMRRNDSNVTEPVKQTDIVMTPSAVLQFESIQTDVSVFGRHSGPPFL
jgi:low temperature requirement protein LtrA